MTRSPICRTWSHQQLPDALNQERQAHIDSFYHLRGAEFSALGCRGMACFVARHLNPERWNNSLGQRERVYCLGKCYAAPAVSSADERLRIEVRAPEAIVLGNVMTGGARTHAAYMAHGGYRALELALRREADHIISEIEASDLRGRGGAGFRTGTKWRAVARQSAPDKSVVANADEGDPGAYIDRFLMEDDPHCLIEAMTIAAYSAGASQGYIYLRKEYPQARISLEQALAEARREHLLGNRILNGSFGFDIQLVVGEGSYVCGEETAMLNSIEGRRPEVRPRPPYPTECGLKGLPTLINNVETLANIPWIVLHGAEAYRRIGFSKSRGTKVLSLNSLFRHPGLYEVPFGVTIRQIIEDLGGGLKTGQIRGVLIGGPLAGIIPPELFETPLGFEELATIGASVGHGGVVAFDENTSLPELVHHVFEFGAFESCGKCTPCRLGSRRIEQIFRRILQTGQVSIEEKTECQGIVSCLASTSLCGLGTGLAEFAKSASTHYGKEVTQCFK
jgi:NADH:ubiquinone oxidoreductase subunit F (NADH-binding)